MKKIVKFMSIIGLIIMLFSLSSCGNKSVGLEYEYNEKDGYYEVVGIGTCTDKKIVIPREYNGLPVVTIKSSAFEGCTEIEEVNVGNNVKIIGMYAFNGCTSLKKVILSRKLLIIESCAFSNCTSLEYIKLYKNLYAIYYAAFSKCTSLKSIIIPYKVTVLGGYIFSGCSDLIVYCKSKKWYSGWDSNWHKGVKDVVMGA